VTAFTIHPLSQVPQARPACIAWSAREWGDDAQFQPSDWEAEIARIVTHPVDEIFVAYDRDVPVGMVWMLEQEGIDSHTHLTPWLSSLVVDPDHRNKGIAQALISHVETYVSYGGDTQLYLLTETPAVYFTGGWEVLDTAALSDRNVFVMQKPLMH